MRLLTADTGDLASAPSEDQVWPEGKKGFFVIWGTWDGATGALEFTPDGGTTWIPIGTEVTKTANGAGIFQCGRYPIRCNITSEGGSTSLSAEVSAIAP